MSSRGFRVDEDAQELGVCLLAVGLIGLVLAFFIPEGVDAVRLVLPPGGVLDPGRMIADSLLRLVFGFLANLWWILVALGLLMILWFGRR